MNKGKNIGKIKKSGNFGEIIAERRRKTNISKHAAFEDKKKT